MNATKSRNRTKFPPQQLFEGKELNIAKAIYDGNTKEIERLIKIEKYDPNGMSPNGYATYLCYAIIMEDLNIMEKLLSLGADANRISPFYSTNKNFLFLSPLGQASSRHNVPMVKLLLRYKANPNTLLGHLPINEALIGDGGKATIELLLANGANVNFQQYLSGETPLMTAISVDKLDYIYYFLDKGADPTLINFNGRCFAYSIQEELERNKTLSAEGRAQVMAIKEKLQKEYHVQFPVKLRSREGLKAGIRQYEALPDVLKNLPGMDVENRGYERDKARLEKNVNLFGDPLE